MDHQYCGWTRKVESLQHVTSYGQRLESARIQQMTEIKLHCKSIMKTYKKLYSLPDTTTISVQFIKL